TVTASAGGKSASVKVTVTDPSSTVDVRSVSISGAGTVAAGKTIQLTAAVTPSNATNKTVTWASLDPSVATVSSTGVVTGVKAGTTTILATAGGVSAVASVTVSGSSAVSGKGDSLGVRRGNAYYLRDGLSAGRADSTFAFGLPSDQVLV
ncbi:Ig-like domain-containing protein, partial [Bifidobacterium boum]